METVDEFMARFRATGLDMLTEQRRRSEQMYWLCAGGHWSTSRARQEWKAATLYDRYYGLQVPKRNLFDKLYDPDPYWRFITIDSGEVIANVPATVRVPDHERTVLGNALDQQRSLIVVKGRSCGMSYHRQALMADVMAARIMMDSQRIRREPLIWPYGSIDPWDTGNLAEPWQPRMTPPQSLGPGKEVEEPNVRSVNAKRVAKNRLKRRIAKKSKRK